MQKKKSLNSIIMLNYFIQQKKFWINWSVKPVLSKLTFSIKKFKILELCSCSPPPPPPNFTQLHFYVT